MTMKAHTYYIIFRRPPIGVEASPFPPGGATDRGQHAGSSAMLRSVTYLYSKLYTIIVSARYKGEQCIWLRHTVHAEVTHDTVGMLCSMSGHAVILTSSRSFILTS